MCSKKDPLSVVKEVHLERKGWVFVRREEVEEEERRAVDAAAFAAEIEEEPICRRKRIELAGKSERGREETQRKRETRLAKASGLVATSCRRSWTETVSMARAGLG